ncbi:MAG: hypothetical protein DRP74_04955 [Candidatus Omnitrophota bacterium]|nr:MAG: hypothetical protein DRP74_04955 [Candidatus Omnitrophota bacterium]
MLKRYQVLLSDWIADYIKFCAEKYDWSFSEALRLILSVEIVSWVSSVYPEYKPKFDSKELAKMGKDYMKRAPGKLEEEFHKWISLIYFEARKATEFFIAQDNRKKKSSFRLKTGKKNLRQNNRNFRAGSIHSHKPVLIL